MQYQKYYNITNNTKTVENNRKCIFITYLFKFKNTIFFYTTNNERPSRVAFGSLLNKGISLRRVLIYRETE